MSGPSDKAVEAAYRSLVLDLGSHDPTIPRTERALAAAHDPALGLNRSVCLRDVVEALEGHAADHMYEAREHILREFGSSE